MQNEDLHFLRGGGECGAIIRQIDWAATVLGPADAWPISLRTSLSMLLGSRFPMFLYWGPQRICFYNDAFKPSLGFAGKHPQAMGQMASEVWPELWETLKHTIDSILSTGESTWNENRLVPIFRNNTVENVYWTYGSSAVANDDGEPYGVLTVCTETTHSVMGQRKLEETNEWLEIALQSGEMGTWDLNTSNYKFHSTGLTKKLFGLPEQEEVQLQLAIDNIVEKDRNRVVTAIKEAISKGTPYDTEYSVIMPDKTERVIHARGKIYYSEQGVADRFAGIVQDVTADIAARRQQQRLVSLVENSKDYMSISGLDGRVIYLNMAGRKLVGLEEDEPVAHLTVKDFHTPLSYQNMVNHVREELAREGKWTGEIQLRHFQTGEEIPSLANVIQIYDPQDGQLIARGITLRDLRPEIAAQQALKESQSRLTLALQATNMGTYDWLIHKDTLTWDQRCRELFGLKDSDEVTYVTSFLAGLHPEDRPLTEIAIAKAMNPNSDGMYAAKYRTIDAAGNLLYWVQATGRCYFDENKKPLRLIGTVMDITEHISIKEDIAEREAHFRLLMDAISQLVWIADTSGSIVYLNKSSRNYTGQAEAIQSVEAWAQLLHPAEREQYLDGWQKTLSSGQEWVQEHRICQQGNEYRWHLTRITPYRDTYSNIEFWVSTSTDIQHIKDQEDQKNDFFQMASHELKTPVTSVKAYTQFLHKRFVKSGDDNAATLLSKMSTQISKLEILISDLLDINRIEGGKIRFNESAFYLSELAGEIIEEVQRTTNKHIAYTTTIEDTPVWGDRYRIGQVFTNLLSNAIKYSPGASHVEVKIWVADGQVHCCVSDFGIGIPLEQQSLVFDRFYRVSGQNTDTFPGLGLGLYISSEIIKRQKGRIQVKSQPQVGSDFCFSLPLYNDEKENLRS